MDSDRFRVGYGARKCLDKRAAAPAPPVSDEPMDLSSNVGARDERAGAGAWHTFAQKPQAAFAPHGALAHELDVAETCGRVDVAEPGQIGRDRAVALTALELVAFDLLDAAHPELIAGGLPGVAAIPRACQLIEQGARARRGRLAAPGTVAGRATAAHGRGHLEQFAAHATFGVWLELFREAGRGERALHAIDQRTDGGVVAVIGVDGRRRRF